MANIAVIFHRLAALEYHRAHAWYARRSPAAALRFRDEVRRVVQLIDQAPDQGVVYRGPFRWMRLRRYPYVLYYAQVSPTQVTVFAVAHASRRTGYWLRRTRP
ncbi:MAG TPA: type II toxin-antitoxin system RelE/ParE family toxin [Gemmataceae bacterium]|nr:type II toxin-antitoxin system RelE/ParE family toxin [Gemmataceae bacterium]